MKYLFYLLALVSLWLVPLPIQAGQEPTPRASSATVQASKPVKPKVSRHRPQTNDPKDTSSFWFVLIISSAMFLGGLILFAGLLGVGGIGWVLGLLTMLTALVLLVAFGGFSEGSQERRRTGWTVAILLALTGGVLLLLSLWLLGSVVLLLVLVLVLLLTGWV